MKQIVFVGGDRREGLASALLNRVGIDSYVFRPVGRQADKRSNPKNPDLLPAPEPGSVLQRGTERAFAWLVDAIESHITIDERLARRLGLGPSIENSEIDDLRAVILSRFSSLSWEAGYTEHFFGSRRSDVLVVVRNSGLKVVLKEVFGFRVMSIPAIPKWRRSLGGSGHRGRAAVGTTDVLKKTGGDPAEVALIEHQGPSFGRLFTWSQYPVSAHTKFAELKHVVHLSYDDLNHQSLAALDVVRVLSQMMWRLLSIVGSARKGPHGLRFRLARELLWIQFGVRSSRASIRIRHRSLRIALFAYDMLVPAPLSLALGAEGICRVATLERPAVESLGLPILVDHWLVPRAPTRKALARSRTIRFRRLEPVGLWRTDFFSDVPAGLPLPEADVLVLPYHVDCPPGFERWNLTTSPAAFSHFIDSIVEVCRLLPSTRFVIRTKDELWFTDSRLAECRDLIASQPNLIVDLNFDEYGRAYHIASRCRVVIGKYTSMMDEARAFGKHVVVHNFNQYGSHQYGGDDLWLPPETHARDQDEFERLVVKALELSSPVPSDEFCDGHVRDRIETFLSDLCRSMDAEWD